MERSPAETHDSPGTAAAGGGDSWLAQYYTPGKPLEQDASAPPLSVRPSGKYSGESLIGSGGEKEVVRVHDADTLREVALARPRPGRSPAAFVREARVLARLEHPNIVPVHDLGTDPDGRPYFTMKLLEGQSLERVLALLRAGDADACARYALPARIEIFVHVCEAAAFAHAQGVVHGDIKPANVQIGAYGEVRLIDWGLAQRLDRQDASAPSPERRLLQGTPGYMAPEQCADAARPDRRTDVYALGALLYALLTGLPPVEAATAAEALEKTVAGDIPPPRQRAPHRPIPLPLEAVTLKAMSAQPERRYPTVDALLADLRAFTAGYATSAEQAGPLKLLVLLMKRHRALTLSIAIAVVALAGVGAVSVARIHASERAAVAAYDQLRSEQELRTRMGRAAVPRLMNEARSQIRAMDYESALQTLRTVIGTDPTQAEAWDLAGWILLGQESYAQAAAAFRRELDELSGEPARARAVAAHAARRGRPGGDAVGLALAEAAPTASAAIGHAPPQLSPMPSAVRTRERRILVGAYVQRHSQQDWREEPYTRLLRQALADLNDDPSAGLLLQSVTGGVAAVVSGARVADLAPLASLPVVRLDLRGTAVKDLQPLKGMPLAELDLSYTAVVNVDALAGSPLRELRAEGLRRLPDNLFLNCPRISRLVVSEGAELPPRATWPDGIDVEKTNAPLRRPRAE